MNSYPTLTGEPNEHIMRLAAGQPVALRFAARNKVILLTPGPVFGFAENILVIAGVGEKCNLIDLRDINVTPMIRAGLSSHAATVLKTELERIYHATTYHHETGAGSRRPKSRSRSHRQTADAAA